MRPVFLALLILVIAGTFSRPIVAADIIRFPPANVVEVYDGDTFKVQLPGMLDVFGKSLPVRIKGIDAPEIRSTCTSQMEKDIEKYKAGLSRQYLIDKLNKAQWVELRDLDRDKYFRLLANVYIDGENFTDVSIRDGHAIAYDGGTKVSWCGK